MSLQPPGYISEAGTTFSYESWTQGTQVMLCNVAWGSDYKDLIDFKGNGLNDYLSQRSGPTHRLSSLSYARFGEPISLPIAFTEVSNYNYVRVFNPEMPHISTDVGGHYLYYFITHVKMVNPQTTHIYVQLDVWQTYGRYLQFGRAFVERGHAGIANSNSERNNGRDFLTVPEGMDLGGEYWSRGIYRKKIAGKADWHKCSIVAVSTLSFTASGGNEDKPVMVSAYGGVSNFVPNGADVYFFETGQDFQTFLRVYRNMPWVTQGILAAYMIPPMQFSDFANSTPQTFTTDEGSATALVVNGEYENLKNMVLISDWRQILTSRLPARYRALTKFLTYPYTFFELTMSNGMPLVVKPESLAGDEDDFSVDLYSLITPPNPRMMISPHRYNDGGYALPDDIVRGDWLDFGTGITSLPQISIVNNGYANYLASNRNAINFQHQSADWSQQRALRGADTAMQNVQTGMSSMGSQNQLGVGAVNESMNLANQTALYHGIADGVGTGLSSGMKFAQGGNGYAVAAGAAIGLAGTAANTAIQLNQNTQQAGIQNRLSTGRTGVAMGAAGTVGDTNLGYAQYAAQGDYSTSIAGINAKVQDAKMIQPTVSGQTGGDAFVFSILSGFEVHSKIKQIDAGVMTMVGEYWLRYGYSVHRFMQMNKLSLMKRFTYWKVRELYIKNTTGCPETFRMAIKGIFESGVTVWNNPDDMASADIGDNEVTTGVFL